MKIKIFTEYTREDAEPDINEFLEGKTLVDLQMNTIELGGKVFSKFLVLYHEPENQREETVPVQTSSGVSTYVRKKGSDEPFQPVGEQKNAIPGVQEFLKLNEAINQSVYNSATKTNRMGRFE